MPIESKVHFLNVDLLLVGRFDTRPLVDAAGDDVFVLHDDTDARGDNRVVLEAVPVGLGLTETLTELLQWVERLPPNARRTWGAASRRVFDIGIQAGREPYETGWNITHDLVKALAKVGAEVVLTVYGAKRENARSPARAAAATRRRVRRTD